MLDSGVAEDVRNVRGYGELRCTLAAAAGYLVAGHELRRDAANAQFDVTIANNFQTPGPNASEQLAADGLAALIRKLV
jgi:hypothetical protein